MKTLDKVFIMAFCLQWQNSVVTNVGGTLTFNNYPYPHVYIYIVKYDISLFPP